MLSLLILSTASVVVMSQLPSGIDDFRCTSEADCAQFATTFSGGIALIGVTAADLTCDTDFGLCTLLCPTGGECSKFDVVPLNLYIKGLTCAESNGRDICTIADPSCSTSAECVANYASVAPDCVDDKCGTAPDPTPEPTDPPSPTLEPITKAPTRPTPEPTTPVPTAPTPEPTTGSPTEPTPRPTDMPTEECCGVPIATANRDPVACDVPLAEVLAPYADLLPVSPEIIATPDLAGYGLECQKIENGLCGAACAMIAYKDSLVAKIEALPPVLQDQVKDVDFDEIVKEFLADQGTGDETLLEYCTAADAADACPFPTPEPTENPLEGVTNNPTPDPTPQPTDAPIDCSENTNFWSPDCADADVFDPNAECQVKLEVTASFCQFRGSKDKLDRVITRTMKKLLKENMDRTIYNKGCDDWDWDGLLDVKVKNVRTDDNEFTAVFLDELLFNDGDDTDCKDIGNLEECKATRILVDDPDDNRNKIEIYSNFLVSFELGSHVCGGDGNKREDTCDELRQWGLDYYAAFQDFSEVALLALATEYFELEAIEEDTVYLEKPGVTRGVGAVQVESLFMCINKYNEDTDEWECRDGTEITLGQSGGVSGVHFATACLCALVFALFN